MYMCFSKTPALSPRGDARPFDASCDGTVLGEGLGIIALKRLDDARRDGDKIYAVIRSVGSSSDGKGARLRSEGRRAGRSAPAGLPASGRFAALDRTRRGPRHGTKVGDATELAALNTVYREAGADGDVVRARFGKVADRPYQGGGGRGRDHQGGPRAASQGFASHDQGDQPVAGSARAVAILCEHGSTPLAAAFRPAPPSGVGAFGFGGSNFHCVLEEAEPAKTAIDWDGEVQLLAFSAASRDGLAAALDAFPLFARRKGVRSAAAQTRVSFSHLRSPSAVAGRRPRNRPGRFVAKSPRGRDGDRTGGARP